MEIYTNIEGIGKARYQITEYVPGPIGHEYTRIVTGLKSILDKSTPVSANDYNSAVQLLKDLSALAKNGIADSTTGASYYMSFEMTQYTNLIVQSLRAANITASSSLAISDAIKISLVQQWKELAGFGVAEIFAKSLTVNLDPHTLQSLVELEYVKAGNDYISGKLEGLQTALSTSQSILDILTIIQGISNQIKVTSRGDFKFPPSTMGHIPSIFRDTYAGTDDFVVNKLHLASADGVLGIAWLDDVFAAGGQFPPGQDTDPIFTPEQYALFLQQTRFVNAIKTKLNLANDVNAFEKFYRILASAQFSQLFPTATPTATAATELINAKIALMQQIHVLSTQFNIRTSSTNSLTNFLLKVVNDISGYAAQGGSWINQWILDNQDKKASDTASALAGSIQNNITQSIKATQSLNDSKKEEVRQYMLYFDQFYKSSSAVLQKVTQMIERMAQQISR